jgi:hypothetical protein
MSAFPQVPPAPTPPLAAPAAGALPAVSPRVGMATRLPRWLQPFLTWLTGQALPGQRPLVPQSSATQIATGLLWLFGGAALTLTVVCALPPVAWPLALVPMLLTASGARFAQIILLHQSAHGRLTGHAAWDRRIGDAMAMLALLAPYPVYQAAHLKHHDADFASLSDPDFQFLRLLGFEPSLPVATLQQRLWGGLLRPQTQWTFLRVRLGDNLRQGPWTRRLAFLLLQGGLAALFLHVGGLLGYLLAWVLPVTVLFNMAALLQLVTEHLWLLVRRPGERTPAYYQRLTIARFQGEPVPAASAATARGLVAWAGWWSRLLTTHLFFRVFVVQGGLIVHDFHHRDPLRLDWPEAVYARQRQRESGQARFQTYAGVWGFGAAVTASLTAISSFPAESAPPALSDADRDEQFRLM